MKKLPEGWVMQQLQAAERLVAPVKLSFGGAEYRALCDLCDHAYEQGQLEGLQADTLPKIEVGEDSHRRRTERMESAVRVGEQAKVAIKRLSEGFGVTVNKRVAKAIMNETLGFISYRRIVAIPPTGLGRELGMFDLGLAPL